MKPGEPGLGQLEGAPQDIVVGRNESVAHVPGEGDGKAACQLVDLVERQGSRQDCPGAPDQGGEPAAPQLEPTCLGQDVLRLVGLVEDGQLVLGEYLAARGYVDAVEVQVGDHHVSGGGSRPGLLGEAVPAPGAPGGARTFVGAHAHRCPGGRRRLDRKVRPVTGVGHRGPAGDGLQLARVGRLGQPVQGLLVVRGGHLVESLEADVVGAALEDGEPERLVEVFGEEGQVFVGQLVLEGLSGGGDDGGPPREDCGHEVGEGLSGTGTGPDDKVRFGFDRLGDPTGHGLLAGAALTTAGQGAADLLEGDRSLLSPVHHLEATASLTERARRSRC